MSIIGDHDTIIIKLDLACVSIGVVRILHEFGQCDVSSTDEPLTQFTQ